MRIGSFTTHLSLGIGSTGSILVRQYYVFVYIDRCVL